VAPTSTRAKSLCFGFFAAIATRAHSRINSCGQKYSSNLEKKIKYKKTFFIDFCGQGPLDFSIISANAMIPNLRAPNKIIVLK